MKRVLPVFMGLLVLVLLATPAFATGSKEQPTPAGAATTSAANHDPFGKYDPPLTIATITTLDDTVKFPPGMDIKNNPWAKLYSDKLGIALTYDWTASTTQQYDDKLNVNIAAGSIPDMFSVNISQLSRLSTTGLINMNMGQYYDAYGSDLLKSITTAEGPAALNSATFNGKLAAFPVTDGNITNTPLMWIRTDWLKKLNLQAPKTADQFFALLDAFTTQDPDGTGAKDYVGLVLHKDLFNAGYADLNGFFNMYHAYPMAWIKDSTGRLVYGSFQPQIKTALLQLQKLYAAGKLDKEFSVKDNGKESELSVSGKNGVEFGKYWNSIWPLQANKDNNKNADWLPYRLPSVDSKPASPQIQLGISGYWVCSSKFQHPEAAIKIANLFVQKGWGGTPDDYTTYFDMSVSGTMYETFKYSLVRQWPGMADFNNAIADINAFNTNDTSKLTPEQLSNYKQCLAFRNGDNSGWGMDRVFDVNGSGQLVYQYFKDTPFQMNEFYGADTATMVLKKSVLDNMEKTTITKIIMGDPISTFDDFVTQAKALGYNDIEKEVNSWYAAQPK